MTSNSEDKGIKIGREIAHCSSNTTYYVNQAVFDSKAGGFTTLEFFILGQQHFTMPVPRRCAAARFNNMMKNVEVEVIGYTASTIGGQ